jgi:hypothetical protein
MNTQQNLTITVTLSKSAAILEMFELNSDTSDLDWADVVTLLHSRGAHLELITRLQELWEKTKIIAGEVVNVGRIIVMKIWEFIKSNPNLVLGVVIGAALGALVNLIPFIGAFLAPIAMAIGTTMGALAGHRLDKIADGETVTGAVFEDIITLAKRFFQLLADIFNALSDEYFANGI